MPSSRPAFVQKSARMLRILRRGPRSARHVRQSQKTDRAVRRVGRRSGRDDRVARAKFGQIEDGSRWQHDCIAPSENGMPAERNVMKLYRGMDRAALDAAYNNRAVVPDWQGYLDRWRARSEAIYAARPVLRDMRYGSGPRQRIDIFPSGRRGAPAILFLHGGYWQWNDKEGQAFVAEGLLAHGFDVAIGEYSLAPEARMPTICAEAHAMVDWLADELPARGLGGGGLYLSGISTGAHLMALALGHAAARGALLISGIYDLEPIRLSTLNDAIGMDEGEARTFAPLHAVPSRTAPAVIAFGADERPEIRRQSADYAACLEALGRRARPMPISGCDHFSVLESLADPSGVLAEAAAELARAIPR
jgi:arylformamidase